MAIDGIEVIDAGVVIELVQDGTVVEVNTGDSVIEIINGGSVTITGGGLSDGDKGDIIVSGDGANMAIDPNVLTAFGRSLADDEDAATARATLGLGSAATQSAAVFEAAGSSAAAVAAHVAAVDPHPTYLTAPEGLAAGILSDIPAKLRDKKFLALDLINGVAASGDDAGNASLTSVEALASTLTVPAGAQSYDRKRKIVAGLANKLRYHHTFDGQPLGVLFEPAENYINRRTQPTIAQALAASSVTDAAAPSGWSGNWVQFGDNSVARLVYNTNTVVLAGETAGVSVAIVMDDGSAPVPAVTAGGDFELRLPNGNAMANPDTGLTGAKVEGPFAGNVYLVHGYYVAPVNSTLEWGGVLKRTTHSAKGFRVGPIITYKRRYPPSFFENLTDTPNSRAGDRLDMPLSGFSSDAMTVFGAFVAPPADTSYRFVFSVNGTDTSHRIEGYFSSSGSMSFLVNIITGGVLQVATSLGTVVPGQMYLFAFTVDGAAKRVRGKCTGVGAIDVPIASTPYSPPQVLGMQFGHQSGGYQLRAAISKGGVVDRAWTAAEIAEWVDGYAAKAHTHPQSDVVNLTTDLAAKAPLASPTFTGTPAAPTAGAGTNTTQIATTAFVAAAIAALANSAPATLDTLNELATALGNDPNFATTITNALAGKAPTVHSHTASQISDSTAAGRAMLVAADAAAQTALINAFTTALKGLVPPPVTVAGKFLKDDGTWDTPAGGSGTPEVYVQQTRPSATGPWLWWETDFSGVITDLTVNDGL